MSVVFKKLQPGVYDEAEQELVDYTLDYISGDSETLMEKLELQRKGKRGIGNMELNSGILPFDNVLGRSDLLQAAAMLNPRNPLYNDPSYAKKTRFGKLPACPLAVECGALFPLIPRGTDIWVSAEEPTPRGLDHELVFHRPILEGESVHSVVTSQSMTDITIPDTIVRKFRCIGTGELRNDRDEVLISGTYRGVETFKIPEDPAMLKEYDGPRSINYPTYCHWDKVRARHIYTDEDWDFIKSVWKKEEIRGNKTRYWDDVQVGDLLPWALDGPITDGRKGGPMMHETTVREVLMDEQNAEGPMGMPMPKATVEKDKYGIYQVKAPVGGPGPGGPRQDDTPPHPNKRRTFQNTVGRNLAARLVTNWMGDDGWLYKLCWRLAFCMDDGRNAFPENYDRPSYLLKVPFLRESGKFMNTHGYSGDLGIGKGYVCGKYEKNGKYYVDIVIWCETIEGDIWCESYAVVELPKK